MFLFIAMLRMANYYLKPHNCPLILATTELIYHGTWPMILRIAHVLRYFWQTILSCGLTLKQIIFLPPLFACWISLSFGSSLAYFCISVLYWLRRFNIEMLSRQRVCDRSVLRVFRDPAGKQPKTLAQGRNCCCLFDANAHLYDAWASWRDSTEFVTHWIQRSWDSALHWLGQFEQTQQILF